MRAVVALVGLAVLAAVASAQPTLPDYAVLGSEGVTLGRRVRVRSGAVGSLGGVLSLAGGVRVAGTAVADTIHLRDSASARQLFCRLVRGVGPGGVPGPTVQGSPLPLCRAFTPPLVDPALLPSPVVLAGDAPLRVPRRTGTAPMPPGSFGDVMVGAGSLLQLAGGDYAFRSLTVAGGGRVVCIAACRIGVAGPVMLKRAAQLGAEKALGAEKVRVDIVGIDGLLAFRARRENVVAATVYAPAGDVVLGPRGGYRGAFVGRTVRVGTRAEIREDSAL